MNPLCALAAGMLLHAGAAYAQPTDPPPDEAPLSAIDGGAADDEASPVADPPEAQTPPLAIEPPPRVEGPAAPVRVEGPAPPIPPPSPALASKPQQASRFGIGFNSGLATGVGPGFRFRMTKDTHLQLTLFPVYVEGSGFFAGGARLQHFVAYFDRIKLYVAEGGAFYASESDKYGSAGLGFGLETGSRTHRGFSWWVDVSYAVLFSTDEVVLALPLPQGGFVIML